MKCVCGYEVESGHMDWEKDEWIKTDETKDQFIKSHNSFIQQSYGDLKEHTMYACPKCGTIKINLED